MREILTLPADRKTTRSCAPRSAIPVMPFPPPLGVVAPHRISRLVTGSALLSRVPYSPGSYIHPSPTALTCYLARREDKSDAEGTFGCCGMDPTAPTPEADKSAYINAHRSEETRIEDADSATASASEASTL